MNIQIAFGLMFVAALATADRVGNNSICGYCDPSKIWTDVVLVIDGSMEKELVSTYIQQTMGKMNIGQSTKSQTRVSIVTYGDNAKIVAKLSTFQNTQQFLDFEIKQVNAEAYSALAGVNAAFALFDDATEHRALARKVIILVAQFIRNNEMMSVRHLARQFQNKDGILISIAPVASPALFQLASTGYYIQANQNKNTDILSYLCDANCYCQNGYRGISTTPRLSPNEGCFNNIATPASQATAKRSCTVLNGFIAAPRDGHQQNYTAGGFQLNTPIYVGLESLVLNNQTFWIWSDNMGFDTQHYSVQGTGKCAYLISPAEGQIVFQANNCMPSFYYACEAWPCSVNNSCL